MEGARKFGEGPVWELVEKRSVSLHDEGPPQAGAWWWGRSLSIGGRSVCTRGACMRSLSVCGCDRCPTWGLGGNRPRPFGNNGKTTGLNDRSVPCSTRAGGVELNST